MKLNNRYTLLLVTFIALLIYYFPNTYSVLLQTHNIINISSPSNDIPCTQCHSKIASELSSSAYHKSLTCEDCHRNPNLDQTVAYDITGTAVAGEEAHAAVKPRCLDCHSKTSITLANGTTISVRKADAFGDANYGSVYSAHRKFVVDSLGYDLGTGENEACLSCHAEFTVSFRFVRPLYYNFTFQSWDSVVINSWGPDNTTSVIKSGTGSRHTLKPISAVSCTDCHSDVWNAINHTEPSPSGETPNSSHVIWYWNGRSTNPQAPIHDIGNIGTSYINTSDYCLSSCHNPTVSGSNPPPSLTTTVHVSRKISCYTCHTDDYQFDIFDKTSGTYVNNSLLWDTAMGNLDTAVFNVAISVHADTCISCKRAAAPTPPTGNFIAYSEPSNLIYYNGNRV